MTDLEYIKKFSKITLRKVCELAGVNSGNLLNGKVSEQKIHEVRHLIESEVAKLYIIEV